jgi:hypothetical protein
VWLTCPRPKWWTTWICAEHRRAARGQRCYEFYPPRSDDPTAAKTGDGLTKYRVYRFGTRRELWARFVMR